MKKHNVPLRLFMQFTVFQVPYELVEAANFRTPAWYILKYNREKGIPEITELIIGY